MPRVSCCAPQRCEHLGSKYRKEPLPRADSGGGGDGGGGRGAGGGGGGEELAFLKGCLRATT